MKTAIQFGAGNIGRGFIGMLLSQSGYHLTFADVQATLVDELNERQNYQVEIVGEQAVLVEVKHVSALLSSDAALIGRIADAEVITTAVGVSILPRIVSAIASGVELAISQNRCTPLYIFACENAVRASSTLKALVLEKLTGTLPNWVKFVDTAVDRIVPPTQNQSDILKVRVEEFSEWLVDANAFEGAAPDIKGMTVVDNLMAGVQRKLFTLNTGHVITAWLGQCKGYKTVGAAIQDPTIYRQVKLAMQQSGAALIQEYHFAPDQHAAYIEKILSRFTNPYIRDDVERVGREPIRKLSANDRIVSPVLMAQKYDLPIDGLLLGAAAGLHFYAETDAESQRLAVSISELGIKAAFQAVSGLGEAEANQVVTLYEGLSR